ncbi:ABC transporter ATP-binding protein [Gordonia sinesedis]
MLRVENLTKDFGRIRAVDNLSFEVKPGMVTGFLGPNGAGKSTTMRMILGLDRPTSGRATIDGHDYRDIERPLTKVGALLDAKWVHPNRSARAHLRWMAAANGIPAKRADEVLDMVGLAQVAGRRAGTFSLGMSQRLGLAGALLGDPTTLLFDEPVNGLDPEGIVWVRDFMRNLAREGRTVLVSSHLLTEMSLTADHLVVIGQGRLIADCSVAEFTASARRSVRVRTPRPAELAEALAAAGLTVTLTTDAQGRPVLSVADVDTDRVGDIAAAAGVGLHELVGESASLEEAFMAITAAAVQYHGGAPGGPGSSAPIGAPPQAAPPGFYPAGPHQFSPPPGSVPPGSAPPGSAPPGWGPAQPPGIPPTGPTGPNGGGR